MFSAFRRLTGKNENNSAGGDASRPPGHRTMSTSLQRKFARGVQYNMKIVIKGDRNVGKTCLFHRLQGKKFIEEYAPTEEIQVTSIHWNYKATDDIVKVEVWDVVDKGKKKKRFDGLKLENAQLEIPDEPALDAEFLDVYKGTNGVIMMMDLTKAWTFDYIQRELPKIPGHIPVIILANHCDMSHHRTITPDHVLYYIESIVESRSAQVRYAESSMRNGFGLKLLHKFFNLPFLQLQKETLLRQLERNEEEIQATVLELDTYFSSDEANYNKFLDNLVKKRREIADLNANIPQQQNITNTMHPSASSSQIGAPHQSSGSGQGDMKRSQSGPIIIGAGKPIPFGKNVEIFSNEKKTYIGANNKSDSSGKKGGESNLVSPVTSVDEFCPEGGQLDRSFLEDVQLSSQANNYIESDSDEDTGNPLVSEFQDDLDDEAEVSKPSSKPNNQAKHAPDSNQKNAPKPQQQQQQQQEFETMKQSNDEMDSTINSEISEINSEAFDSWMAADTRWRRSPEGGEDDSVVYQTLDFSGGSVAYDDNSSLTSSNIRMELLSSRNSQRSVNDSLCSENDDANGGGHLNNAKKEKKKKDKDKSEKKHKHKKSKDKDKSGKESSSKGDKKHKRRSREETSCQRDELEEFLNGTASPTIDSAYEAI
ncbi:rab-like protein 6 [Agrilus planipennis]|uniref:Rab-like protein 6 n=1 Tax=Agrilus planipennis TaxID=224129 RepID=A0A1W4XIH6_AGRPL|nr:rab-like protein 6 [Agrilus planipennis]